MLEEGAGGKERIDAYLALNIESSDRSNQRYLTGFDSSLGVTVVLEDRVIFLTDSRYSEAAEEELTGAELERIESRPLETTVELINGLGINSIAVDQNDVSLNHYNRLVDGLEGVEMIQMDGQLAGLRQKKEPGEIELQEEAARIADRAFSHLVDYAEPGMTERDVALELEFFMRDLGAEDISFPPIVAAGAKSALPHAKPGEQKLKEGENLLVDMGAKYRGYCSDMTRTVYFGEPPEKFREVYEVVLEAQQVGLEELGPGVEGEYVHEKAAEVIASAGYGERFGHGLGHGVGLDVHEGPRLSETSDDVLEPGMVVTVEPGIYIPEWGGVRIEDMVRITENGYVSFSGSPKEKIINPLDSTDQV